MTFENFALVTGGILTGFLAGLFVTLSVAFVLASRSIKGTQPSAAVHAINVKIGNPILFLSFRFVISDWSDNSE